jgi:Ca2+-binding RTX toxin-like protein
MFFLRKFFNRSTSPRPTPQARPSCEPLEDRLTPASTLTIDAGDGPDVVRFQTLSSTRCRVFVNDVAVRTFSTTGTNAINKVVVLGGDGDDKLNATKSLVPVVLQGGNGDDNLFDSKFSDLLIGGPDADNLQNRFARDVLVGGEGDDDVQSSGAAGAILFGGITTFNVDDLNLVRKEWNSSRSYFVRIDRILNAPLNWGAAVSDEVDPGDRNTLIGSDTGRDWFLRCQDPLDPLVNARTNEEVTPVF